eukprot:sb/3462793/
MRVTGSFRGLANRKREIQPIPTIHAAKIGRRDPLNRLSHLPGTIDLSFTCSPFKKTDLKAMTDLLRGYQMLFKLDLWNPRGFKEEEDITRLVETCANALYAKVKQADTTSHQDMRSQLESMTRTVIRLHVEIESFSNEYRSIFKCCQFDVQVVVYETVISLLISDVKHVMCGVQRSWSKVLPEANKILISSFTLYNSINQFVQANDPTNDSVSCYNQDSRIPWQSVWRRHTLFDSQWGHGARQMAILNLSFTCSPFKKTDLKAMTDLLRGYQMLFKLDLWNPRGFKEEEDITRLVETCANALYAKVKQADTTSHQDMRSQLESMTRTVIRLHVEIESFSNEYRSIFKCCQFDVQVVVYETVISLLISDVKHVMCGVQRSWSKVLPEANKILISSFTLYNSINQFVQANDPTNDRAARLQHIFSHYFLDLVRKWAEMTNNKLSSHGEKLIIMEKIQSDSALEDSSLSAREVIRAVKNRSQLESMTRTVIRLHVEIESFSNEYRSIFKCCQFDVQVVVYETVISLLISDVKHVMCGVQRSWSKVLPEANKILISSFTLYNSINQFVQANDPTNDRAARLQHIFSHYFLDLVRKWAEMTNNKLSSHGEKLIIMEKIQSDSALEDSSLSAREVIRAVKNICRCWSDLNTPIWGYRNKIFNIFSGC